MASHHRHNKGKTIDQSTPWSKFTWSTQGFFFASRYGPDGEIEYDYRYPSESGAGSQEVPPLIPDSAHERSEVTSSISESNWANETQDPATVWEETHSSYTNTYPTANASFGSQYTTGSALSWENVANINPPDPGILGEPQYIRGDDTSKSQEELGDEFEKIGQPSRFFKIGRVFKTLWTEPAGNVSDDEEPYVIASHFGQKAYTKVRRFVVVREMQACCLCLALYTYKGQGTLKIGVKSQDHAAVFAAGGSPTTKPGEVMDKDPFPIIVENWRETVDPMSRLNFGRVYTVEHNVKVLKVGRIPDEDLSRLNKYFSLTIAIPAQVAFRSDQSTSATWSTQGNPFQSSIPIPGPDSLLPGFSNLSLRNIPEARSASPVQTSTSEPELIPNVAHIRRDPASEDYETLDPRYRTVEAKNQRSFWKVGRVFMMLWTEPARSVPQPDHLSGSSNESHFSTIYLGQGAYSEIRRFVVVGEGYGNSICSPIHTYAGQGTLKPNLPEVQQHAIIYTSKYPPEEISYTAYDGTFVRENLNKDPIRVVREQRDPEGDLDPASRINYSKIYTVENYVRVLNIGMVHISSIDALKSNSLVRRLDSPQRPRNYPSRADSSSHHKNKREWRRK